MENIVPFIDTTREVSIDTNTAVFHVLHYIAIFEAAINLFGFYVIAFHTPQSMRNYGRALSAYQIVSLIADGLIGSALAPYLIFPVPGGLPMGWMWKLGISTQLQIIFGFVSVGHMVTLMVTMFIVRHQTILPQEHALKLRPGRLAIFYSLLQIWPYLHFTTIMIYTFYNDDQDSIKSYYANRFPILRQFLLIDRFYAFSLENGMNVCINVTIWVFIVVIIISVVVLSCFHVLESRKNKISPKTFRLQRKWIHKCILQVSIPMITLLFPVLASIYIFVSQNLALVGLIPLGLVLFSLHGLFSTIVTLSLYRPYYAYVEQIVWNLLAKILPCIFAPRTFAMGEATTVVPGGSDRRFSLAARMAKTSFTRTSVVQSTF